MGCHLQRGGELVTVLSGRSGTYAEHGTPSYGSPCASMRNRGLDAGRNADHSGSLPSMVCGSVPPTP